jgi:hypothetical protein
MSTVTIVCDQAVFTSARGPTGEGYRIVAAGKGLRADEKQKITRCSPSHESLCAAGEFPARPHSALCNPAGGPVGVETEGPVAVAFYPLPSGRFCLALSRHAGAEQSGRGGQRVFTHNIIIRPEDFQACGANPFHLVRAMPTTAVEFKSGPAGSVLPTLELSVDLPRRAPIGSGFVQSLPPPARAAALDHVLQHKPVVIDMPAGWLTWAEALFVGLPAPLRAGLSLAAGLKFSATRGHLLNLLRDDKNVAQGKAGAQGLGFISPTDDHATAPSRWFDFVDRLWSAGNLQELSRRTSRPFEDCSAAARERIGDLFHAIDAVPQTEPMPLLDLVFRSFQATQRGCESDIRTELQTAAQSELIRRYTSATGPALKALWPRLVEFWRNGREAAAFAQPLIHLALQSTARADALAAAEQALAVANLPPGGNPKAHEATMNLIAAHLQDSIQRGLDAEKAQRLLARWRSVRPGCAITRDLGPRFASHAIS